MVDDYTIYIFMPTTNRGCYPSDYDTKDTEFETNLVLKVGGMFSADASSGRWEKHARLCFAKLPPEVLKEGVRLMSNKLRKLLLEKQNGAQT